jgi:hypothetical protein
MVGVTLVATESVRIVMVVRVFYQRCVLAAHHKDNTWTVSKSFGYTLDTEVRSASASPRNISRGTATNTSLYIEYHPLEASFRLLVRACSR